MVTTRVCFKGEAKDKVRVFIVQKVFGRMGEQTLGSLSEEEGDIISEGLLREECLRQQALVVVVSDVGRDKYLIVTDSGAKHRTTLAFNALIENVS